MPKSVLITACLGLFAALMAPMAAVANENAAPVGHLRLVDRLDRPEDGYCLDILGTGEHLRLALPVFAHNCKPFLTTDSAITVTGAGEIVFVAVNACVTVFGVNGRSLPGSPIVLRACDDKPLYFDSTKLQHFDWTGEGRLQLSGSDLCLTVGDVSATTHVARDRWRTLSVEPCNAIPAARAVWEFVRLN